MSRTHVTGVEKASSVINKWEALDKQYRDVSNTAKYQQARLFACSNDFSWFVKFIGALHLGWTSIDWYQKIIIDDLNNNWDNPILQYILNMPQQMGKTTIFAMYIAFFITKYPKYSVIYSSYDEFASIDTIKLVKNIITCPQYIRIFGSKMRIKDNLDIGDADNLKSIINNANAFQTVDSKGKTHPRLIYAVSINQGFGGKKGHLVIIDDLMKEPITEINSITCNKQWNLYNTLVSGRAQRECAQLLIPTTRYASDDLCGRIAENQGYKTYGNFDEGEFLYRIFPAIQVDSLDPKYIAYGEREYDTRKVGELLPREKTKQVALKRSLKANLPSFDIIYQNMPSVSGSFKFPEKKFFYYPQTKYNRNDWVHTFAIEDSANKGASSSDDCAVMVFGVSPTQELYVLDIISRKMWHNELIEVSVYIWNKYQLDIILIEEKSIGNVIANILNDDHGLYTGFVNPNNKPKMQRLKEGLIIFDTTRIYLPSPHDNSLDDSAIVERFLEQCRKFTGAARGKDDMVDCFAYACLYYLENYGSLCIPYISLTVEENHQFFKDINSEKKLQNAYSQLGF